MDIKAKIEIQSISSALLIKWARDLIITPPIDYHKCDSFYIMAFYWKHIAVITSLILPKLVHPLEYH